MSTRAQSLQSVRQAKSNLDHVLSEYLVRLRSKFGIRVAHRDEIRTTVNKELLAWAVNTKPWQSLLFLDVKIADSVKELFNAIAVQQAQKLKLNTPLLPLIAKALAGPLVVASYYESLFHVIKKLDNFQTDGMSGRISVLILNLKPSIPLPPPIGAPFKAIQIRQLQSMVRRIGSLKKRIRKWRKSRRADLRLPYLDDASSQFRVLETANHSAYTQIKERVDFYRWFYEFAANLGHELRWSLAASMVAEGARLIAHEKEGMRQVLNLNTESLQAAMRVGNQVIFDDVLPKLRAVIVRGIEDGPIVDQDAYDWDANTLAEEQTLIQPLYRLMSRADIEILYSIASLSTTANLGNLVTGDGDVDPGPYNKGGRPLAFRGSRSEIVRPEYRWRYGMAAAAHFSTLVVSGSTRSGMPPVPPDYSNGSKFQQFNVRPNIHLLRAVLEDVFPNMRIARQALLAMSKSEQDELRGDVTLLERFISKADDQLVSEVKQVLGLPQN